MTDDTEDADSDAAPTDHDREQIRDEWSLAGQPSVAIAEAIADATGREPTALPPLHRSVDPDALDALLTSGSRREERVHVSFPYDGVLVSVGSDGELTIREDDPTHEPPATGPETGVDLQAALRDLLEVACRNGVPVTGGYGVRNGPELPDWDVHITEVEKRGDGNS